MNEQRPNSVRGECLFERMSLLVSVQDQIAVVSLVFLSHLTVDLLG